MCGPQRDISEVFADIALVEDRIVETAYAEGFSEGVTSGNTDAYHLGYHRGAEIGAEFGYYLGIVALNENCARKKQADAVKSLKQSLEGFQGYNCGLEEKISVIRGKFHKVCALLGIKGAIKTGELDF
ncbi:protein LTO1 homolog [Phlebotomus papatasi]|uniref:protein LTO1 homolog n=1 Tax=Phlebotomus papatasi TaxID=29031 RepID=UPI00248372CD|nr:protein LTO1 homolog [Phlebotomus papatasi]